MDSAGRGPRNPRFLTLAMWLVLALFGVAVAADGLGKGMARHQVFAIGLGLVLAAPFTLTLLLGERWFRIHKRLVFSLIPALAVLALIEITLRIVDPPGLRPAVVREDPLLGHALVPGTGGSDAWGFRNDAVPEQARIVCIGDSQTWGDGVAMDETWPAVLAETTGQTVYSMGLGGYGPLQYLALQEKAVTLDPDWIVVGLFLGNDLPDAHRLAGLEAWREYRDPEVEYRAYADLSLEEKPEPNLAMTLLATARDLSRLVRWAELTVSSRLKRSQALADTYWQEPGAPRFEDPDIGTLFTPQYRLNTMSAANPAVRDGLRITKLCFEEMRSHAEKAGASCVLLVLHTKEYTYRLLDPELQALDALTTAEQQLTDGIVERARSLGWIVVDPTPDLLQELRNRHAMWPPTSDGHFNPAGQRVLAKAIARALGL